MQSTAGPGFAPIQVEPGQLDFKKIDPQIIDRVWGIDARTDSSVSFEEYLYWAKIERAEEHENNRKYVEERGPLTVSKVLKGRLSKGVHHENEKKKQADALAVLQAAEASAAHSTEKEVVLTVEPMGRVARNSVSEEEWKTAARALRTASWGTIFYLITTDILGWSTTPFVFASVGYGTSIALYVIFGIFAFISGWILWRVFLALDSSRFPIVSFGDPFFRVYGKPMRHFINITQSIQQFMTVCVLVLGNAVTISQLSMQHTSICFIVCMVITTIIGMVLGNIRSLQRVGWLANASVWMNVVSFIMIMVACANFGIDYQAVFASTLIKTKEAIHTFAGFPPNQYQQQAPGFAGHFNGINSMVYSWGGALLFVAFLAEMRHPWDFWKGMLVAQVFIGVVYIFFGAFVYGHYGQYAISNIVNVIQPTSLQTVANVFSLLTSFIACLLYFNIGMKTVYQEVLQEIFSFPHLSSKKGKVLWFMLGPIYWIVAFLVAAAVPNLNGISGLVGALLILNFTYTFPALLYFGFTIKMGAILEGEGFDPSTRVTVRHDEGIKRWIRGYRKAWIPATFSLLYFCGGLATSGMGTWAAVEGLIAVFGPGGTVATSFGCASPV